MQENLARERESLPGICFSWMGAYGMWFTSRVSRFGTRQIMCTTMAEGSFLEHLDQLCCGVLLQQGGKHTTNLEWRVSEPKSGSYLFHFFFVLIQKPLCTLELSFLL